MPDVAPDGVEEASAAAGGGAEAQVDRLGPGEVETARTMFRLLDEVFEHDGSDLSDDDITDLLARPAFWAVAAQVDGEVVGGLTAHELPMTRGAYRELFLYDLAVHPRHQRRGVATRLVRTVVDLAAADGIEIVFVPAADDDDHALAFYEAIGGRPAPVTMFDLGAG